MLTGGLYALQFRSPEGSRADHPDRQRAAVDRRQGEPAGGRPEGAGWLAEGQSRQGVGRHRRGRRHRSSHRHFVPEGNRHQFQFVPYRGNGPAMQDLLSGQIDFMIEAVVNFSRCWGPAASSLGRDHRQGAAALVAGYSDRRRGGFAGLRCLALVRLWVQRTRRRTSWPRLNATVVQVLADLNDAKRFAELGIRSSPRPAIAGSAARVTEVESERWWPIIRASNIKVD